jgi:uncharacterized C2H2 Zn-finger protein
MHYTILNMALNPKEQLDLKRLISESDCENNTELIRHLKHSVLIRDDIRKLDRLKSQYAELRKRDSEAFLEKARSECGFLFKYYTDIFNKVAKDELDLLIMTKVLHILRMIEDGEVDQHEGSVLVGKMLKELYIDSAIKHADNSDRMHAEEAAAAGQTTEPKVEGAKISWKEYKNTRL